MSAAAGFAPVASPRTSFHRGSRRCSRCVASATSREPARDRDTASSKWRSYDAKTNNVIRRGGIDSDGSPGTRAAIEEVRAWCIRTDGGAAATQADVAALRRAIQPLRDLTRGANDRVPPLAKTRWRLAGCAQATLHAPATWLASPFFWIAKEAQHESARLAAVPDLFPPYKLAASLSAGGRSGEGWIVAFGERKTGAPFPFNVGESILNGLAVPFTSHAATVEFDAPVDLHDDPDLYPKRSLKMTSRIEVAFGDGAMKMAGDLVTECALLHAVSRGDDSYSSSIDESIVTGVNKESIEGSDDDAWFGDAPGRSKDAAEMDEFASWRMGGFSAVAEKFQRDEQDEESRSVETPVSSPIVTREEIDDRRACLLTTRFERTGTVLDEVDVESGKIMGALMSPSPRLRRSFRGGGRPSVPYASVWCDGELMIAEGGSCDETSTLLVYVRVPRRDGGTFLFIFIRAIRLTSCFVSGSALGTGD